MPSSAPSDTAEAASIRAWMEEKILATYGLHADLIGNFRVVYQHHYTGSFLTALLDGLPSQRPEWSGDANMVSNVFFRGLGSYLAETSSHLVQFLEHDGACWEVRQIFQITSDWHYLPWVLGLLHREPADQAGATYLMLLADDRRSAVVLADLPYPSPPYIEGFSIVFYGDDERTKHFMRHLNDASSSTESILL